MMRSLGLALIAALAIAAPAQAQQTKAQINSAITTQFPDQNGGGITPQNLRSVTSNIVNSIMPTAPVTSGDLAVYDGTTGLLKDGGSVPSIPAQTINAGTGVSLGGTCSGPALNCTVASTASGQLVLPSRTSAASQNLTGVAAIQTLGYASSGDGGGATFKNVGTTQAFLDSQPTNWTLTSAGTGCTNGTYNGILLRGLSAPTGVGTYAEVTVSGGAVTSWNISTTGGGYNAGDTVYQGSNFTCSAQPVWTVAAVSIPSGSFTDSVGNRFQILMNPSDIINAQAFGLKNDWDPNVGDSGATNNTFSLQQCLWFAYAVGNNPTLDAFGTLGATCALPPRVSMSCALELPQGVHLQGAGQYSTTLKVCDTLASGSNFITVCDPQTLAACFGAKISDLTLIRGFTATAGAGSSMVFSNNIQDTDFLYNVNIVANDRSCITLTNGYGGTDLLKLHDFQCGIGSNINQGINVALVSSGTVLTLENFNVTAAGGGVSNSYGVNITGGYVDIRHFHIEGITHGIYLNYASVNNGFATIHNATGGSTCTDLIERLNTSPANTNVAGGLESVCNTINNGGSVTTGNVYGDVVF